MTVAAVDRLVHHATILELNVDSYRRRVAAKRQASVTSMPTTSADNLDATQHEADADNHADNKEDITT